MLERVTYPTTLKYCLGFIWALILGVFAFPIASETLRADHATTLFDVNDQPLAQYATQDNYWRFQADLKHIDPNFVTALLAIEDERFYTHSGVDLLAIGRALRTWKDMGTPKSGASTLTMQLVRQYKPRPRTFGSKVLESVAALKYELVFSKDDILSQYLTRISYGGNIQGIEAATWRYFGQRPDRLTWDEIALLIALPQAPEARRPDRHPAIARAGRDKVLSKLVGKGVISPSQAEEAKSMSVPSRHYPFPSEAEIGAPLISQTQDDIRTFIDPKIQKLAHRKLSSALAKDSRYVNASIVVVENRSRKVVAHVTAGERSHEGGWLDLTNAVRSPGSTLKPFIYGLAMSDGKAGPNSAIKDAPTRFGAYQPENFNRRYYGDVRLKDALKHSLNVPAVAALDKIGAARFEQFLSLAGATPRLSQNREKQSGLSLALGGAGMTAVELATLYTALANDGVAKPLKWTREGNMPSDEAGLQILPKETVAEITSILASATPPSGRVPGHLATHRAPVAYKTGTSYGARDSWAAGYTQTHTIIVWVGRPDGAPRPGETGRKSAAPLLFDVFDSLAAGKSRAIPQRRERKAESRPFKTALDAGPQISFPANGAEVLLKDAKKPLLIRAQSDNDLRFYINGERLEGHYGKATFRPPSEGFYTLKVVDADGRIATSRFRVFSAKNFTDTLF